MKKALLAIGLFLLFGTLHAQKVQDTTREDIPSGTILYISKLKTFDDSTYQVLAKIHDGYNLSEEERTTIVLKKMQRLHPQINHCEEHPDEGRLHKMRTSYTDFSYHLRTADGSKLPVHIKTVRNRLRDYPEEEDILVTPDDIFACLESTGKDTLPLLNECESRYLNFLFEECRDTFDFTGKRILFGSWDIDMTPKQAFFERVKDHHEVNDILYGIHGDQPINSDFRNLLIVLSAEEAAQTGYDAMIGMGGHKMYKKGEAYGQKMRERALERTRERIVETPDDIRSCLAKSGKDAQIQLTEDESRYLNYRYQDRRGDFDFTGKRVVFLCQNSKDSKKVYFRMEKEYHAMNHSSIGIYGVTPAEEQVMVFRKRIAQNHGIDAAIIRGSFLGLLQGEALNLFLLPPYTTPADIEECLPQTGLDSLPALNECESKCMNYTFRNLRHGFDFTDKRVAFLQGRTGEHQVNKRWYFYQLKSEDKRSGQIRFESENGTKLLFLTPQEVKETGYDVVIVSEAWGWIRRKAIIKRLGGTIKKAKKR